MRRTTAAVAGTLSGTALLLAAKFGTAPPGAVASDQAGSGTTGGEPAPGQAVAPPGRAGPAEPSRAPGKTRGGGSRAATGLKDGVFRGAVSVNPHGPIQVTITVSGGRITDVSATHGSSPAKTVQVNRRAIPILRQQALTAQSARIDTVSGATYTSGSFRTSLQSALAAAKA